MFQFKNSKGFTLIELMVVISTISLLSSIVLATISTARDKAKIAAGQRFSTHIRSALYDVDSDRQNSYSFDECSGSTAYDQLGSINLTLGTLTNFAAGISPSGDGCSMYLNTDGLATSALRFEKPIAPYAVAMGAGFTIAYWIKTTQTGALIFSNRSEGNLTFETSSVGTPNLDCGCNVNGSVTGNTTINDDKWHHVAWSINWVSPSDAIFTSYVDGKFDSQTSVITYKSSNSSASFLGHDPKNSGNKFTGYLDDLRIYNKAVSTAQAEQIYLAGLAEIALASRE